MDMLKQGISVFFEYEVHFTKGLFDKENPLFSDVIKKRQSNRPAKILIIMDASILENQPSLSEDIITYTKIHHDAIKLCHDPLIIPSGESIKNNPQFLEEIYYHLNEHGLCRHSYVIAIGGGALLDMVGYAAATAHRGIRLIRVPTTVLSQADSGVGVKNGINYFNKKNFLGAFAPPYAVLNDVNFLETLGDRDWLSGIAEAIKVSLIKDKSFFEFIHQNTLKLGQQRNMDLMEQLIHRCAELHMHHIGNSGDPFEMGSSRPLDFGHWAAHKLEQLTQHRLRHGEAVAIGLALDTTYSYLVGFLPFEDWQKILWTLHHLGFCLYVPELSQEVENLAHPNSIFRGLAEFQEHLGGELTIMMLKEIGKGIEVHTVDIPLFQKAMTLLEEFETEQTVKLQEESLA